MFYNSFSSALAFVQQQGYVFIFLAMVIEGPIITTAASFAASLGLFSIWVIFLLSLLGDLVGDVLHYFLGYLGREAFIERFGSRAGISKKFIKGLEKRLRAHLGKTLFFVKFTPFITTPGLMMAGALKVPLKRYLFYSFAITLPRTLFFTFLGFYFGVAADNLLRYFRLSQFIIPLAVICILFIYLFFKYLSRTIERRIPDSTRF